MKYINKIFLSVTTARTMLKEKGSFFAVLDTHNLVVKQVETCILGSILLQKDQNAYYRPF